MIKFTSIKILLIVLMVLPEFLSAQDSNVLTPYAQVRAWLGYVSQSKEISSNYYSKPKSDLDWSSKLTNSRMGLRGKFENYEGCAEVQLRGAADSFYVTTRRIYFIWNYSLNGNILIGQNDLPFKYDSRSVAYDDGFEGFGATNARRDFQLKLTYMGAYFDIVNPNTTAYIDSSTIPATVNKVDSANDFDVLCPRLIVGYEFVSKNKIIQIGAGFVFQSLKINSPATTSLTENPLNGKFINAYMGFLHGKVNVSGFSIQFNYGAGSNLGNLGVLTDASFASAATSTSTALSSPYITTAQTDGSSVKNTFAMEGYIDFGYNLILLDVFAGVGYAQSKQNLANHKTDAQITYYAQISIPIIDNNFYLKPEVQYRDFLKDSNGKKQGNEILAGVFAQAIL